MSLTLSGEAESRPVRPVSAAILALLRGYKRCVSPWMPAACRFVPTCSEYAADAVRRRGAVKGTWMALKRLGRCHPLHKGGFDPVP